MMTKTTLMPIWRRPTRGRLLLPLLLAITLFPGCVRVLAIGAKVIMGDPSVTSPFEVQTGISLQKGEHAVAVIVDVPHLVADDYSSLGVDLQEELLLRFRRHGLKLADPDIVVRTTESAGNKRLVAHLAKEMDVDCIIHVKFETFTDSQSGNPNLLQTHAQGMVKGFEVRGEKGTPQRHVVEVYEQSFLTTYPTGHPLAAEQTPRRKFVQNSIRKVADEIGRQFYDVNTSELF